MRKSTKKLIMALSIVFIMIMAPIAFVVMNQFMIRSPQQEEDEFFTKYSLGYTFVTLYYSDPQFTVPYIDQLPDMLTTNTGQVQIVVEKIQSDDNYINLLNFNTNETIYNVTYEKLFNKLCDVLLSTPVECVFTNLTIEGGNVTNSTNFTI